MNRRAFFPNALAALITLPFVPAFLRQRLPPDESMQIWTTMEGVEVRICDMTDDHLRNCIFYLNKVYGLHYPSRIYGHTPAEVNPIYDVMRREAQRRHLSWI